MLKNFLLAFLFLITTLFAADTRLESYPNAVLWEQEAINGDADAMYNLGHTYQTKVKDYDKAIFWYKKAYEKEPKNDIANNLGYLYDDFRKYDEAIAWYTKAASNGHALSAYNLGLLYDEKLHHYDDAIKWYKKAYELGDMGGANALGYLYKNNLGDTKQGIKWYSIAVKQGESEAIKNLGNVYHDLGDNIKAAAYIFAMANYGYSREEVLDFLKNDWNLDRETLQKAYELQKTLDIPKHYTGGID